MRSPGPTVSVVIPCFNAARFIEDAVETVFTQSYNVREVVCVDDGSTDETLQVLRRLQSNSNGTVLVVSRPNGGPSAARNTGLSHATGDYIQFLDADDLLDSDKIASQISLIQASDPPPDIVAAAYIEDYLYSVTKKVVSVDENHWVGLFCGRFGITSANLYGREAVLHVGGWNEEMKTSEDPELAFRLLKRRERVTIDNVPRTLLRRRQDSQWNADTQASMRGWLRLRMLMLQWLRDEVTLTAHQWETIERTFFMVIRGVWTHDRSLARQALDMLPTTFRPSREQHGKAYLMTYRLLGFESAERLTYLWRRCRGELARFKHTLAHRTL